MAALKRRHRISIAGTLAVILILIASLTAVAAVLVPAGYQWLQTSATPTTETLIIRPSGDVIKDIPLVHPMFHGTHWDLVDDVTVDHTTTEVYSLSQFGAWSTDIYSHSFDESDYPLGVITKVTEYICVQTSAGPQEWAKFVLDDGVLHEVLAPEFDNGFQLMSYDFTDLKDNWTWDDIRDCTFGVSLRGGLLQGAGCTQVYLKIEYNPPVDLFLTPTSTVLADCPDEGGCTNDSHHLCVDDPVGSPDGSSSFIGGNSFFFFKQYKEDRYKSDADLPSNGEILQVVAHASCQSYALGTNGHMYNIVQVGTDRYTQYHLVTNRRAAGYVDYTMDITNEKDWTWNDIEDIEFGVQLRGLLFWTTRCTQVYLEIKYLPGVGPTPTPTPPPEPCHPEHEVGDWWLWKVYYYNNEGAATYDTENTSYIIENVRAVDQTTHVYENKADEDASGGFDLSNLALIDWNIDETIAGRQRVAATGVSLSPYAKNIYHDSEIYVLESDATIAVRSNSLSESYDTPLAIGDADVPTTSYYTFDNNGSPPDSDVGHPYVIGEDWYQDMYTHANGKNLPPIAGGDQYQYKDFDWEVTDYIEDYDVSDSGNCPDIQGVGTYDVWKLEYSMPWSDPAPADSDLCEYWYSCDAHHMVRKLDKLSWCGREDSVIMAYEVADFDKDNLIVTDTGQGQNIDVSIDVTNTSGEARSFDVLLLILDMDAITTKNGEPYINGKTVFPDMTNPFPAIQTTSVLAPDATETITWTDALTLADNGNYKVWCSGLTYEW